MAKAGKKKRSPSDMARLAFRKKHGRWPKKGETKTRKAKAKTKTRPTTRTTTADAPKRRPKKRKPKPALVRAWRWVKKNPIKSVATAALGTALAVPASREGLKNAAVNTTAIIRK